MRQCIPVLILCLCACGNPPPPGTTPGTSTGNPQATAALIQSATSLTVSGGLSFYAKDHPAEAAKIAAEIKTIVDTVVLPYLNSAAPTGVSSGAVNAILQQHFAGLPQVAKDLITLSATLLDSYLPAPSPDTYLSDSQLAYVKAFFTGLSTGTGMASGGTRALPRSGKWLNLK